LYYGSRPSQIECHQTYLRLPREFTKRNGKDGDWLGTGAIAPRDRIYKRFVDASSYVHSLGLKNSK